jgi:MFS family permease
VTNPRLPRFFIGALMLAYFGSSVALYAPLQNVLPRLVESATGSAGKAAGLGLVTGLGALAALIANPVAGHFSDRRVAVDNRTVAVLAGLVGGAAALSLLSQQRSLAGLVIAWTLCQATINIAYSSMAASVYDQVPNGRWGLTWGLIAVAQSVGLVAGFVTVVRIFPGASAGLLAVTVIYAVCLTPLVVALYRLPRRPKAKAKAGQRTPMTALLSAGGGFGLVWSGKFLVMLANSVALLYLFYYLQDVVHYPNPGAGQLILVVVATVAAIAATVTVGRLADRSAGYRRYAVLAAAVMAATAAVLAGISLWPLVIVCAFALGAGYGAFQSVSQALSMTVLPDPASAGRDLGIINIAAALPAVIGPPLAAFVVTAAGGYRGLFAFAGLLSLAAAVVFTRVPGPRPNASGPPLEKAGKAR